MSRVRWVCSSAKATAWTRSVPELGTASPHQTPQRGTSSRRSGHSADTLDEDPPEARRTEELVTRVTGERVCGSGVAALTASSACTRTIRTTTPKISALRARTARSPTKRPMVICAVSPKESDVTKNSPRGRLAFNRVETERRVSRNPSPNGVMVERVVASLLDRLERLNLYALRLQP